jgi:uncharacterized cupin superfamily protein
MPDANVFTAQCTYDETDPPGFRNGHFHVTQAVGAKENNVKLYELPPGESLCPYHYEYEEEWLLVLQGAVILRTPEGERPLQRGDIVCFPVGPAGAHKASNSGPDPARVLMFSNAREPAVAVYPDSDKIGVFPGNDADNLLLRRADGHRDYWDGES